VKKTALTRKQHIGLDFISKNTGLILPAGKNLPPAIKQLEKMGLIRRVVEFIDCEGKKSIPWDITEKGKKLLEKIGTPVPKYTVPAR
jgi:DNA-binding PadR family transcriptional regulator